METREPANDWVHMGSGNVLKDLDVVFTEAEWEDLCRRNGSSLPYPYAKVIPIRPTPGSKEKS